MYLNLTTGRMRSFLHSEQAESSGARRPFAQCRRVEAGAVIPDEHLQQSFFTGQLQRDAFRPSMARDVRECFLRDAETGGLELARESFVLIGHFDRHFRGESRPPRESIEIPAQSRCESEIVQQRRTKID